nr:MAG TPA: Terminase [Caudoviricetes sp.]
MGAFSCEDTGKKKSKKVKNGNKTVLPGFENWNDRLPECVALCEAIAAYGTDCLSVAKDYFDALRGLARDNMTESYEEELTYMVARGKEFFDVVNRMLARSASAKTSAAPEWYELKRKVCLLLAPHSFDHYMQYVEWNREPARKFWVPRRSVLMGLCNDLQDLEEHKIKFLGVSMPPRVGKLLSDDTPILTTRGWMKHGDLRVGDEVFSPDGNPVKVTHVFPKGHANIRVWFWLGRGYTHIDCHENHEWVVFKGRERKPRIVTTKKLMEDFANFDPNKARYKTPYYIVQRFDTNNAWKMCELKKPRRLKFAGFERIEPVQGNCISVEGGVYLAGDRLVPTHNSTICIFFLTWHMGRHPDDASAMGGHSDTLVNGFYGELNAVLDPDGEYLWHDVFPHAQIESRSAKYLQINLNHPKRFPTMTCRSAEGTWTGAIDISRDGILYVDDLVKDLEESLSPSRLDAKYNIYLNQMKDRMKDGALQLMVGTRWNVMDPLGRVREQYRDNPDYRFTVIPALDANGESNFQYDYGVGFSTEYYRDMKASIDDCTWCAKYQGAPYVRQGLVFPPDSLLRYNGVLPGGSPERIIAACDVAWGGEDYLSMPIVYVYGDGSMYCVDVVFSNANKVFTQPEVVGKLLLHRPHQVQFEANNGGTEYAQAIDEMLRAKGCSLNISTRRAPGNASKLSRIIQYAPDIAKIHFLDFDHSTPEYRSFIEWLCSFVSLGKNVHDDAPDSLAQLMDLATGNWGIVSVQKRVF